MVRHEEIDRGYGTEVSRWEGEGGQSATRRTPTWVAGYGSAEGRGERSFGQPQVEPARFGEPLRTRSALPASERSFNPQRRGPKGYRRADDRILDDVAIRFMRDCIIDAREVEISVADGVVSLKGSVPHRGMKFLAEELVESVLGVREVDNQLRIPRPGLTGK